MTGLCLCSPTIARQNPEQLLAEIEQLPDTSLLLAQKYNALASDYLNDNATKARYYAYKALGKARETSQANEMAKAYYTIGSAQHTEGNVKAAAKYYANAIALWNTSAKNFKGLATAYNSLAVAYEEQGNYQQMARYSHLAIHFAEKADYKIGKNIALHNLGIAYAYSGQPDSSAYYYQRTARYSEEIKDTVGIYYALEAIANTQYDLEQYKEAENNYKQAINMAIALDSKREELLSQIGLAHVYMATQEYGKAESGLKIALDKAEQFQDVNSIGDVNLALANLYTLLNRYRTAQVFYNKALAVTRQAGITGHDFVAALLGSAKNQKLLGNIDKAEALQKEALATATENNDLKDIISANQALARLYKNQGSFKKAYMHLQRQQELSDSLNSIEKTAVLAELQQQYESEKKERTIELLEQQNAVSAAKLTLKERTALAIAVVAGLVMALMLVAVAAWHRGRRNNRLLKDKNSRLKLYTAELNKAAEEIEQQRASLEQNNKSLIAARQERDELLGIVVHDLKSPLNQVKGLLNILLSFNNSATEKEEISEMLTKAVDNMQNRIDDLLRTEQEAHLEQVSLSAYNLVPLLHEMCNEYRPLAEQKKITITFDKALADTETVVTGKIYKEYFRYCFENLLSNAIKFSPNRSEVQILLNLNNGLNIGVADRGKGIPEQERHLLFTRFAKLSTKPTGNETSTGLGLYIVKKYANAMEANVRYEPREGKGSIFWLILKGCSEAAPSS